MRENINKVTERGERLDSLQDKTGEFVVLNREGQHGIRFGFQALMVAVRLILRWRGAFSPRKTVQPETSY
jgi:hypothetical protein